MSKHQWNEEASIMSSVPIITSRLLCLQSGTLDTFQETQMCLAHNSCYTLLVEAPCQAFPNRSHVKVDLLLQSETV